VAAHLPLRLAPEGEGLDGVDLAPAIQYCTRNARKLERAANASKIIAPIGSSLILFLFGFWSSGTSSQSAPSVNTYILYIAKIAALIMSISSALNYVFDFNRRATKYNAARRALEEIDTAYHVILERCGPGSGVMHDLRLWVRDNLSDIERLLNDDRVVDIDRSFNRRPAPSCTSVVTPSVPAIGTGASGAA
jgi:hypothetical protein